MACRHLLTAILVSNGVPIRAVPTLFVFPTSKMSSRCIFAHSPNFSLRPPLLAPSTALRDTVSAGATLYFIVLSFVRRFYNRWKARINSNNMPFSGSVSPKDTSQLRARNGEIGMFVFPSLSLKNVSLRNSFILRVTRVQRWLFVSYSCRIASDGRSCTAMHKYYCGLAKSCLFRHTRTTIYITKSLIIFVLRVIRKRRVSRCGETIF